MLVSSTERYRLLAWMYRAVVVEYYIILVRGSNLVRFQHVTFFLISCALLNLNPHRCIPRSFIFKSRFNDKLL